MDVIHLNHMMICSLSMMCFHHVYPFLALPVPLILLLFPVSPPSAFLSGFFVLLCFVFVTQCVSLRLFTGSWVGVCYRTIYALPVAIPLEKMSWVWAL